MLSVVESKKNRHDFCLENVKNEKQKKDILSPKLSNDLSSLSFIKDHFEQLKTYQYLLDNPTEISKKILELYSEDVTAIRMTLEELHKIPFYNFGKRNKLKNELSVVENSWQIKSM